MSLAAALPVTARRFAVVCFGFTREGLRRQPWHMADGLARGLAAGGADVLLLTDAADPPGGLPYRVASLPVLFGADLRLTVRRHAPERCFVLTGATRLARLGPLDLGCPATLVLTGQRFALAEFARLGPAGLWRERSVLALPLLDALLPGALLRRGLARSGADDVVYLSEAARRRWSARGLPAGRVLRPRAWPLDLPPAASPQPLVAYFGPALETRGADLALAAFERACERGLDAGLLLLLRPDGGRGAARLAAAVARSPHRARIRVVRSLLDPEELAAELAPATCFLLPFRLTVSDVPLVVIEAGLTGRPVIVLDTPGVAEIAAALGGIVARSPDDLPAALAEACARPPLPPPPPRPWTDWQAAVRPLLEPPPAPLPALVALIGADGVGKTRLADALHARLAADGQASRRVWSRYRNYLSRPLLGALRLTGHNRRDEAGNRRLDLAASPWLARLYLALQVADLALDRAFRFRRGVPIVADRCALDTLVDWCVATGLDDLVLDRMAPYVAARLPRPWRAFLVERPPQLVAADRPDALADPHLVRRRGLYRRLARRLELPVLRNDGPADAVVAELLRRLPVPEDRP